MAPQILDSLPVRPAANAGSKDDAQYPAPLKLSGALDQFSFEETTPAIGREFHNVNIVDDLLNATNSDELVRDLAITSTDRPPSPNTYPTLTKYESSLSAWCGLLPRPR